MVDQNTRQVEKKLFDVARSREYTGHLHFYFSDTTMVKSGDRGLRLDKLDKTDETPVAIDYLVQGVPFWGQGMDFDTNNADGSADMVYCFDFTANAGKGQDCARVSNESNASGGSSSKTPKFLFARTAGSTVRSQTSFFVMSGGDNSNGLGGLEVQYWDAGGGYDALHLTQRNSSVTQRACINFNGAYAMGNDEANINSNDFWLTDKVNGNGSILRVNTTGQFIIFHDLYHAGTKIGFYNTAPVSQPAGNADVLAGLVTQGLRAASSNPPLNLSAGTLTCGRLSGAGTAPGVAAGAQAGTSPPAPVLSANSTDMRGQITFGTGAGATAGAMVRVTYNAAYAADPVVILQGVDDTVTALGLTVANHSANSFDIYLHSAPASSQSNATYKVNYFVNW